MDDSQTWAAAVVRYVLSRDISGEYSRDLRTMCGRFEAFAENGSPLMLSDIRDALVNAWLEDLKLQGFSRKRIYHHRAAVIAVWREEIARGNMQAKPEFVRTIRPERQPVECWTLDEARLFVDHCHVVPGMMRDQDVTRAHWWRCFGYLDYDTALRRKDVLSIPWDAFDESSGTVRRSQNKTGSPVIHWLNNTTIEHMAHLDHSTPYILTWPYHHSKFDYWMRKIVKAAGIRKGTAKWFRRTSASHLESQHPGHASRHLGHATPGMVRYYLDPAITNQKPVRPPEL